MGYSENHVFSSTFWDKAEELPDYYIIQAEIKKAVSGQPFFVNSKDTRKPIFVEQIHYYEFYYYYKIWQNCDKFGLPHGKGWFHERNWLLEFVKMYDNANNSVDNMLQIQAMRKQNG